jgi:translation initiation factor IF-3
MHQKKYRTNNEIRTAEVRIIFNNENKVLPLREALQLAKTKGLDLIEVSPESKPPVCKIEDFGKFIYAIEKNKKHEKNTKVKELQFHVNISEHDYQTKLKQAKKFLETHHPLSIKLQFRGRENVHKEMGIELLERVANDLSEVGHTEGGPKMAGKNAMLRLSPGRSKTKTVDGKETTTSQNNKVVSSTPPSPTPAPAPTPSQSPTPSHSPGTTQQTPTRKIVGGFQNLPEI